MSLFSAKKRNSRKPPSRRTPKPTKLAKRGWFLANAFRQGLSRRFEARAVSAIESPPGELVKINNETLIESVAELMDDADALLRSVGFSIDESVDDPQKFVEIIAEILSEHDLDEDVEGMLCLGASLIESFMLNQDIELEDLDEDTEEDGEELAEASMLAKLNKSMRRRIEKAFPLATHWKHAKGDELAAKEPHAVLRAYLDKKSKVLPMPKPSAPPQKKQASNEEVEDVDGLVNKVVEAVEAAGYEVPDDLPVMDFLEATEALAETDPEVNEGLAGALGGLAIKALKSKTAAWAAKKLVRAGTKKIVQKLGAPTAVTGTVPEDVELVDDLLATMVEVMTNNGYAFEGSPENFDPESFVEAAKEIAETDEDLDEEVSAWLKKSAETLSSQVQSQEG